MRNAKVKVLVIDAQGGGIGKQLVSRIKKEVDGVIVTAVGTNSSATAAMKKAGADRCATGENSVIVACRDADVIAGPIGIIIADSMIGEITPKMACAVAQSEARRILIPFSSCDTFIAGTAEMNTGKLIDAAMEELKKIVK